MEQKTKVRIKWRDARLFTGTYSEEDCMEHKMCLFDSLGYLVSRDEVATVIAGELSDEGNYRNITLIPTGSIVSIKELTFAV